MRPIGCGLLSVLALLLSSFGCAFSKPAATKKPTPKAKIVAKAAVTKHVFIISFDGGKPAVLRQSETPTLFSMVQQGAVTWTAQTIKPSITLVSHTSMLTGVQPAKHKIFWNDWQPKRGVVTVPTVFSLAHAAGYKTALFAGKEKFKHLDLPGSLDKFEIPGYQAQKVAAAAAPYIIAQKPNLCFIHFADGDGAGHKYGWGTPEQKQAFADTDAALKVVLDAVKKAGIESTSTFILSADHGGHDRTHGTDSPEDMNIPWIAYGARVKPTYWIRSDVSTCDTAATALWLLGVAVPTDFDGKPVTNAFR
jgi:predicted AlkP superfamily pyrophosphatase or phosphodiesterase